MSEILTVELGSLIEFQRGFDLPKTEMVKGIYPVRSSNGILGYHNEYKVKGPGITIGRSGTVGIPHLIRPNFFPHNTSLFIKDFKSNNVEYIFYLLKNLKLGNKKSGSGVPTMNRNHLHPLRVVAFTDNVIQFKIAKVLSDLDAKIELNNKIISELEGMAKLLYDYWFVQFDFPDANGKPYKTSGGKMVFNEELKREIPEGWEVKELGDITDIKAGGDKPKVLSKVKTESCRIPIYSNGVTEEGLYGFTDIPKVLKESITVSARGTIGYSVIRMKPFVPIIRLISITPKNNFELKFLHERIEMLDFDDSGSVQKQLTVPQISKMKVIVPNSEHIKRYHSITSVGIKKIESNKEENQKLSELRDWLLPMLMNGQVRVGGEE